MILISRKNTKQTSIFIFFYVEMEFNVILAGLRGCSKTNKQTKKFAAFMVNIQINNTQN